MAGDAFVIGGGLAGHQRTVLVVASVDHHSSAARAIGGAGYIFRGGRVLLAKFFHGLDIELGGWEQAEGFGKLGRHLGDVAPVGLENLLAGSGDQFGIGSQRGAEALEIREAKFLGDDELLGFNALDFTQAELMDGFGIHAGRSLLSNIETVEGIAVRKRQDPSLGTAFGGVVLGEEAGELTVGGPDFLVDGSDDSGPKALAIRLRDCLRETRERLSERVGIPSLAGDVVALLDSFLE